MMNVLLKWTDLPETIDMRPAVILIISIWERPIGLTRSRFLTDEKKKRKTLC